MKKRYYKDTALTLMNKGFKVVPITRGEKFPKGIVWQTLPQTKDSYEAMLKRFGDNAGVGVITTDNLMAIDIDIQDPHVVRTLILKIKDLLSTTNIMVRRGKKPKALIPCYVGEPFGKVVSNTYESDKYGKMQIELLCASADGVRQFVAYGDYPTDDLHYEWENDYSLLDIGGVEDLPTFTHEMIQKLFRIFDDLMYQAGYTKVADGNLRQAKLKDVVIEDDIDYDLLNDAKVVNISDERVAEIVNSLTEGFYDTYDKWLLIGQALKFQISDSDKAFGIWRDWSRRAVDPDTGKPYDISDAALKVKWRSFKNDRRNIATFASVLYDYYSANGNKNFNKVYNELKRRIDECADMAAYDAIMNEIAYNRFTEDQSNALKQSLTRAYKQVYGEKISVSSLDKSIAARAEHLEMPDYMKKWVYLLNGDRFYDTEDRLSVTPASFDTLIYHNVADAMSMKMRPQDLALRAYKIPKVIDAVYMPTMGSIFKLSERSKYQYVNAYDGTDVPAEPDTYSQSDKDAITRVEAHFEHMIADPKEREIFRQWVAYQVQYTGHMLGWAVFLHGVGGDGKSFFHYLISAMIGKGNAKIVSQDAMKSGFTKWATDSSFGTVEEVYLHGVKGVEIYDKLKTIIASPTIAMIAKNKDEVNVPNTTNYLFLSNRLAALPIDASDRRIFAIYSRWQDAKKMEEFKTNNPKYYPELHNTYKYHAGALRKYFRTEVEVTDEFLAYYDAPRTTSRGRLIGENLPEAVQELLEIVRKNDDPFLCEKFLDVKYFRQIKLADRNFKDANIKWQQYLIPLGYELVSNAVRLPELDKSYLHVIYSKKPQIFKKEGVTVPQALRNYVIDVQTNPLDYSDEVSEDELDDL